MRARPVAAIVGIVVWLLVPEPLVTSLVPDIGRGAGGDDMLSPLGGGLVLAGWVVVVVACGAVWTASRDAS